MNSRESKTKEALEILKSLGMPEAQQNRRSALVFLSLINLEPNMNWEKANAPYMGITPLMEFTSKYYKQDYKPNTRETIRKDTIHQLVEAGIAILNPDDTSRPTNSPKTVYQISTEVLKLIRTYKTNKWDDSLNRYQKSATKLREKYRNERKMTRIPLKLKNNKKISLSPGDHNELTKKIIDDFCGYFAPGAEPVYIGDTQKKWAYFERKIIDELGIEIDDHGKMPDVIVYYRQRKWLILIEAVTSTGPMSPKRIEELKTLFRNDIAGLVFVTAFLEKALMMKFLNEIGWETEIWISETPTHIIHLNGERFLGPYD